MAHDTMRGLSLKQPWLYAITDLGKRVENRTWTPPIYMMGERIALHASKTKSKAEWIAAEKIYGQAITKDVPTGAIVATAVIVNWIDDKYQTGWFPEIGHPDKDLWKKQEKWFFGPFGWILDLVHELDEPIPCKGMLGLWQVSPSLVEEINRQLVRDGFLKVQL